MNVEDFNHLQSIPKLITMIEEMSERMMKYAPLLTTKKDVARFLNKSERTINNYISQGSLREGYHFYRKNGKILVFIEETIFEFRNDLNKGIV